MSTLSSSVAVTAPVLKEVVIHDPLAPETTLHAFPYGEGGRGYSLATTGEGRRFAGRTRPVFSFSDFEEENVDFTLIIPYGDDWETDLGFLDELIRSQKTWVYRDDRGRIIFGVALAKPETDAPYGTLVSLTVVASDYAVEVSSGVVNFESEEV